MRHHPRLHRPRALPGRWSAALAVGLSLGLPGVAAGEPLRLPLAEPLALAEPFTPSGPRDLNDPWIELDARPTPRPPEWMGENVYFKKGSGFEYRRGLFVGDRPVELGFQGPVVRKKKRVGLTVEVRF